ncbi:diaminopimelate decarboxylase [Candidatus Gillettellia adelgis]
MPYSLNNNSTAFNAANLLALPANFGCPVWAYDADIINQRIAQLRYFDVIRFAQKACSNIHILRLMRKQGVKVDSVSLGEIERALKAGFQPCSASQEIVFTADVLDQATLARVSELKIPVNVGSSDMLDQLGLVSAKHPVWLRINPGFGYGYSQKTNTGGENSKHGIWYTTLPQVIEKIKYYGLKLIGVHMHIGSGINNQYLERVCETLVEQVISLDHDIRAISAGGGLPIPYQDGEKTIDIEHYYYLWNSARERIASHLSHPVQLEIEPGRFLTAEAGVLLAEVRAVKDMGTRHFVLVDAGFNDLMRPAMYGSYHHISLLPADGRTLADQPLRDTVIAGPLCESGDVFTQKLGGSIETRDFPPVKVGDYLVFHDTGAYGASMSSNYNSRPLLSEVLFEGKIPRLIRRRQTIEELIALEQISQE